MDNVNIQDILGKGTESRNAADDRVKANTNTEKRPQKTKEGDLNDRIKGSIGTGGDSGKFPTR